MNSEKSISCKRKRKALEILREWKGILDKYEQFEHRIVDSDEKE
ncbi:hypothetical protein [Bacillus sp. Bva_UNVM-123]